MFKKTITFEDLDGNDVTEDFYFHLSKAEIATLQLSHDGGFDQYIQRIIDAKDGKQIMENFENIIMMTVGKRDSDGKQFIKSDEVRNAFRYSDAYSVLFMELITNADAGAEFVNGAVPKDLREQVARETAELKGTETVALPETSTSPEPQKDATPWITENREPTPVELKTMTQAQLQEAFVARAKREQSA